MNNKIIKEAKHTPDIKEEKKQNTKYTLIESPRECKSLLERKQTLLL
jgi:hypothetical protein